MTTTLPCSVPSGDKNSANVGRPFVLGSQIQIAEHDYKRTWKSSNGIDWASTPWSGVSSLPPGPGGTAFVEAAGGIVNYYYYSQYIYAVITFDGHSWDYLGGSSLPRLPSLDHANNAMTFTVVHGGVVFRFTLSGGAAYVTSSADAYTFSESVQTNLPLTYASNYEPFLIVSFGGYLWSIPRGTAKAVYKSANGISWSLVTSDLSISSESIVSCTADGSGIIALTSAGHTWTTTDGITWTKKSYTEIAAIAGGSGNMLTFSGKLYLLRGTQIFRRTDAGGSAPPSKPL